MGGAVSVSAACTGFISPSTIRFAIVFFSKKHRKSLCMSGRNFSSSLVSIMLLIWVESMVNRPVYMKSTMIRRSSYGMASKYTAWTKGKSSFHTYKLQFGALTVIDLLFFVENAPDSFEIDRQQQSVRPHYLSIRPQIDIAKRSAIQRDSVMQNVHIDAVNDVVRGLRRCHFRFKSIVTVKPTVRDWSHSSEFPRDNAEDSGF